MKTKVSILAMIIGLACLGCSHHGKQQTAKEQDTIKGMMRNTVMRATANDTLPTIRYLFNPIDSPLTICGITVGHTTDPQVVKRLGKGYYYKNLGHGGGRLFYDSISNVTMMSIIGVDRIIEEAELYAGKAHPFYINEIDEIPNTAYRHVHLPDVAFNGFPLGLDTITVRKLFGKPRQIENNKGKLIYQYYFKYGDDHVPVNELPPSARFAFHNDSLISVACEESD